MKIIYKYSCEANIFFKNLQTYAKNEQTNGLHPVQCNLSRDVPEEGMERKNLQNNVTQATSETVDRSSTENNV